MARQLFRQNKWDEAHQLALKLAASSENGQQQTRQQEAYLLLSKLALQRSRYLGISTDPALQYLEKVDSLLDNTTPTPANYLIQLGDIHTHNNNFTTALPTLEKALYQTKKQEDNAATVQALCALSRLAMRQNQFDQAGLYIEEGLEIIDRDLTNIDEEDQAEIYLALSQLYLQQQKYPKLLDCCEKILEFSKRTGDVEKEMVATNSLGIYFANILEQKKAMEQFIEALDISKRIGYRAMTGQYLINIATLYAQLYNFDDAIARYQTLLEQYDDMLDNNTRVIVFNNLGNIQLTLEKPQAAQPHFERSLDLARRIQYKEMVAHSLAQLCRTNIHLKHLDRASTQLNEADLLFEKLGEVPGQQIHLLNKGSLSLQQQDYDTAIKKLSQGLLLAKRMKDDTSERRGYKLLSKLFQLQGDFEQALKYQIVYSEAREDFYKEVRNRQSIDLEIKYAIKEKQQEIDHLRKENEYKDLLLEQQDQLARQNTQLIQANDELRQFAYAASHDLKEPLRMIGSYTQLIHKKHQADFDEKSAGYFQFISEGVSRMNNLLDGLLKYATVGKTETDIEEVNLKNIVELVVINLRHRIDESNGVVDCGPLPTIQSIKSLWIQVFQNLISNGLKFTKPEIPPQITIRHYVDDEELIISVADNGIGIDPEFNDRIFVIFQRLHRREEFEGTGIGLAICQKIMQRLDGRIWVDSAPDQGATFFCAVPISSKTE